MEAMASRLEVLIAQLKHPALNLAREVSQCRASTQSLGADCEAVVTTVLIVARFRFKLWTFSFIQCCEMTREWQSFLNTLPRIWGKLLTSHALSHSFQIYVPSCKGTEWNFIAI